jgi:hypothetical protein
MIFITLISFIPLIALGVFFPFFAVWLKKNHGITLPAWILASTLVPLLLGLLLREEHSMLVFHLTDEVGIPAADVGFRILVLRSISSAALGLSHIMLVFIGISETLNVLQQTPNPPSGFWLKFSQTKKMNNVMGAVSLIFAVISASIFGIYYHIT